MVNQLGVVMIQDIMTLYNQGLSRRKIAQRLGVNRETVCRHIQNAQKRTGLSSEGRGGGEAKAPNPAISPAGSTGSEGSNPANSPPGSPGRKSQCECFQAVIEEKLQAHLTAQRIWQDLQEEHQFEGGYDSVKRFVRRLGKATPLPFRRMECEPGQEAQVDFGKGAPIQRPHGRWKSPNLFRLILSFSRKGYSEAVWRQDTETFIRCLENAFWSLGGVPRTLVIDNLRAAVSKADWYDPILNPKIQEFARHYGTVILPSKPRTPRHKGKVEGGVDYCQENGLKDRRFMDLAGENAHLTHWEAHVADTRIHGTTRHQVKKLFETMERPALLPLPAGYFPFFQEGQRSVHRDGHVEVEKAYYSVPPQYVGVTVWVRYDSRLVRILNLRLQPIAVHPRVEPGKFSTQDAHISPRKISGVERGADYLFGQIAVIGPVSHQWATAMLQERGIPGIRVLQGFLSLRHHHAPEQLEQAAQLALRHGYYHLQDIRNLLKKPHFQPTLTFTEKHPMIRDLGEYQALFNRKVHGKPAIIVLVPPAPVGGERTDGPGPITLYKPSLNEGDTTDEGRIENDAQDVTVIRLGFQPRRAVAGGGGKSAEP